MAASVAKQVLNLVANHHVNESGNRITLDPQWAQIYADPSPDMRIISSAQSGKTLYEIVKTFAQLTLGLTVGWVMPKYQKVQELVHGKLDPTIKNTPLYRDLQLDSGGNNTVQFKTFGNFARLYLVTANSKDELTSFTADGMHIDERDYCNRNHLPMYPSRMNFSKYAFSDEISTPTVEGNLTAVGQAGQDNIHREFLTGDQFRYHTECPFCGLWQILDWYNNVVEVKTDESGRVTTFDLRDQDWQPGTVRDLRVCCTNPQCRRPFDRTRPGRWMSLNPGARLRSYWVEALASAVGPSMESRLYTFQRALGNPSKMQHFHNMDLGRPFAGGVMRFTAELFERCQDLQHHMLQSTEDGPCTIGIDVNRPWLDVQISQWKNGKQIKIFADKIQGGDEAAIVRLVKRFKVVGGVIDQQPELTFATNVQDRVFRETGARIIRCKYATDPNAKEITISEAGENPKIDPPRLITVNKTSAVDALYESMQMRTVVWFAEWREVLDGELFREFGNPVRRFVVNDAGAERIIWEGKPDHQLHAACYDRLAGEVLEMNVLRDYSQIGPFIHAISHSHRSVMESLDKPKPTKKQPKYSDDVMIIAG